MRANENIISNLHKISIGILISLNVITEELQNILEFGNSEYMKIILLILIDAGLYIIIFYICKITYFIFWKLKYPECNISGTWYHYHYIEEDNNYLRLGTVNIKQTFFYIKMTGENHSVESFDNIPPILSDDKITYWHSTMGKIKTNGEILTSYISERTYGASDIREGIHRFDVISNSIKNKKPTKIIGKFKDCTPNGKYGCIVLYRDEQLRDSKAQRLYREHNDVVADKNILPS